MGIKMSPGSAPGAAWLSSHTPRKFSLASQVRLLRTNGSPVPTHRLRLRALPYLMPRRPCLYVVHGRYGAAIPARGGRSSRQKLPLVRLAAPPVPPHLTPVSAFVAAYSATGARLGHRRCRRQSKTSLRPCSGALGAPNADSFGGAAHRGCDRCAGGGCGSCQRHSFLPSRPPTWCPGHHNVPHLLLLLCAARLTTALTNCGVELSSSLPSRSSSPSSPTLSSLVFTIIVFSS